MMLQMGKLIRQLRKQQGISQQTLGNGIISKSELSRVENNLRTPDVFVLSALLERLGKSLKYFEIVVSNQEYEMIQKKEYTVKMQTLVVAEGDYFKDIREAKGLSQEKFSADICARETISKIENGRTPQHKKIQILMEKQGENFEKYYGYVVAQTYEIYEMVEQYQQRLKVEPEAAKELLQEIKRLIDVKNPVNHQFLESSELMEKKRKGILTPGEEMAALESCLRYTMPEYDGTIYRIPHRQEVVILEEIIKDLECLKQTEAAKRLAQKLHEKNEKKLKVS